MTDIRLYNTKTREKEPFRPLDPQNVRMYVCGPTVYDRAHIGNARPVLVFDVLYRLLRHEYGPDHVTYVRNFTDVDDKINARAAESGRSIGEITAETTRWYLDDMAALGALQPSIRGKDHDRAMPRATGYIAEMIAMIAQLIRDGFAYAREGHVLFRVRKYEAYGALSGRSVDDMIAGARVEVAPYKEDPMDFVLWKPSTDDLPGWPSPWGRGRPGWHIECSAMADALLGSRFDIHGGGNDLMFPHHENEIAQSVCAGHDFAQVWMHNEMLQVEGKKMSKSLGNFFTVRDLLDGHDGHPPVPGEVIRFVFLSTHYRKPMDWTEKKRQEAGKKLDRLALALRAAIRFGRPPSNRFADLPNAMQIRLADDLDTHGALEALQGSAELVLKIADGGTSGGDPEHQAIEFMTGLSVMGLYELLRKRQARMEDRQDLLDPIARRMTIMYNLARAQKNFTEIDRWKAHLSDAGVEVLMGRDGVDLKPKPDFDPARLEALK